MNRFLSTVVAWLRAGYPEGVPHTDYVPLLALLARRLTDDEVLAVAEQVMFRGTVTGIDIGTTITYFTDQLPSPEDVERVQNRLAAHGWPLGDARDDGERP